ncbi:AEC family transporter [Agrococcus sp. Marseille-P2731]|uniref:AEC family transporter n=1 Tax=Agrococcus sp. Marseille-P2731 TaxID=1841862 RepID=UPI001160C410|nr:AEC family transporter [Agrococcus sp. Marseille-P2731]
MFIEVVGQTLPLFFGMALGFAASWARPFRTAEPGITAFVFYVALPALLFTLTAESELAEGVPWQFVVTIVLSLGIVMGLLGAALRLSMRRRPGSPMHLAMAGSFGNVAYLGIPVVLGVLGPTAGLIAVVGQLVHNLVFLVAYPVMASVLLARARAGEGGSEGIGAAIRRSTLQSPLLWSVAAGAAVNLLGIRLPALVTEVTGTFAAAAAPAALFAIGLTLRGALGALRQGVAAIGPVAIAAVGKIVLLPLVTALLAIALAPGLDSVWVVGLVILAAMPTSASAFALVGTLVDRQSVATVTLATNAISMLSVPAIAALCMALLA